MEQLFAERLARELKIDVTQVVREYWELLLLDGLFKTPESRDLVFKGGTALRLAYGSPRFSEDLDFSLLAEELTSTFEEMMPAVVKPFPAADITDLAAKRWTYLCEVRITEGYLPQPFRIKLEISKRPVPGYESRLGLIASPSTPVQVLCRVATLAQLMRDKQDCIKDRAAPKDLFDLWFISQKMGVPYTSPDTGITSKELRRELGKYLPLSYLGVIEELA